jgi:hypothetical protein
MARPVSLQALIDSLSAISEPNLPPCPDWDDCQGRKDYVQRVANAIADWCEAEAKEAHSHGVFLVPRQTRETAFAGVYDELSYAYSDLADSADERAAAVGMRVAAE